MHGVCEVIERDQTTRWYARNRFDPDLAGSGLSLESVTDEHCRALLDRCADAKLSVHAFYVTQDMAVPCFMCMVFDHRAHTLYPQRAAGFGCHPYRRIALSRAITEALQSRLTFIAGARDDVYWGRSSNRLRVDDAWGMDWARSLEVKARETDYADVPEAPAMPTSLRCSPGRSRACVSKASSVRSRSNLLRKRGTSRWSTSRCLDWRA